MTDNLTPEAATYLALMQTVELPDGWDVSGLWLLLAGQVAQLMADRRKVLSVTDLSTLAGAGAVLAHMAAIQSEAADLLAAAGGSEA